MIGELAEDISFWQTAGRLCDDAAGNTPIN